MGFFGFDFFRRRLGVSAMNVEREMDVKGTWFGEDPRTRKRASSVNAKPMEGGSNENEKGWVKTPLFLSRVLSRKVGCKVYLKLEVRPAPLRLRFP